MSKHLRPANDGNAHDTHPSGNRRTTLALRGAISAATATAVLLGGFGTFALWQDAKELNARGTIQSGTMKIDEVTPEGWYFAGDIENNDGVFTSAAPIDVNQFKVSPGDVLEWRGEVTYTVDGDDMRGRFQLDESQMVKNIDGALDGLVDVELAVAGDTDAHVSGNIGTTTVPVTITVAFSRDLGENGTIGQHLTNAVTLDNINLSLIQETGA